ncbi:uncharacterized protein LOC108347486 isoform X3 [Vigna angularis]|uniref:uncharacterized protein LOC108347486 isoform X3 n=1 Tax=Phaseolus angularis TaxID=3914 RepID=UPI0022B4BCD0|nr:uncharacterized protein LOC108347486 isoform X3 [Vigna angularis]
MIDQKHIQVIQVENVEIRHSPQPLIITDTAITTEKPKLYCQIPEKQAEGKERTWLAKDQANTMAQAMSSMAGSLQLSGSTRLHAKRVSSVTRAGFAVRAQHQQEQVLKRVLLFWAVNFPCAVQGTIFSQRKQLSHGCTNQNSKDYYLMQDSSMLRSEKSLRRTLFLSVLVSTGFFPTLYSYAKTKSKNPYDEKRLLKQNQRIQKENNAPEDFPNFIREGFEVKIVSSENYVKSNSGLIYRDFVVGQGDCPKDGQQVTFHYIGYNESGRRIDSTYLQGTPAKIRMGTKALVPEPKRGGNKCRKK